MTSLPNNPRIISVSGRSVPICGDDIDTDQILPARFLKAISFQGMEAHVFTDTRAEARRLNQLHPLDDSRFADGVILLVNKNFGCGSSREHAPQGLRRLGIRAIIGESFGEIFASNCVSVGMPCVQATGDVMTAVQHLNQAAPDTPFTLDLEALMLSAGRERFPIKLAEGRRRQFIAGTWDPTSVLLEAGAAIERTLAELPWKPTMKPSFRCFQS